MVTQGKAFEFQLVSPERILFQGHATMVVLPAVTGSLGVLVNHAPTLVTLAKGIIDVYNDNEITHRLYVGGGFANITEQSCLVMADDAIAVEDLREDELQQHIQDIELAIEKSVIEEERQALRQDALIARSKVDIIRMLMPDKTKF
jgi:F-type H+-transporting ATPase subunit epsilon